MEGFGGIGERDRLGWRNGSASRLEGPVGGPFADLPVFGAVWRTDFGDRFWGPVFWSSFRRHRKSTGRPVWLLQNSTEPTDVERSWMERFGELAKGTGLGLEERFGEPFGGTGWKAVCRPTGFWSGLEGPVLRDGFGDRFWSGLEGPVLRTDFGDRFWSGFEDRFWGPVLERF